MNKYENPPIFKVGQWVCFQLPKRKESRTQYWNVGEITAIPARKDNETGFVLVQPYEIPESFCSREPLQEWACLDPLRIDFTRDTVILNLLSGQTRVALKTCGKIIQIPVTDCCPATFDRFRRALTTGKVFSPSGKQSFW